MSIQSKFNEFFNEIISRTKTNKIIWKPLTTYSANGNLEDLFQCANDMADFFANRIKYPNSYYTNNHSAGTLFLIEVYHPTTPFSGTLYLISLDKHVRRPINLSSYFNVAQGDLVALRIVIENNLVSDQVDLEGISYFIDHFFR
ncbi:MAG: hypothetical protein HFI43_12825 [Lachnospiraceae bacterium]|jgi:hypothetical protein|nr:hypothetical protein [Lachnospiraceae bacterium]